MRRSPPEETVISRRSDESDGDLDSEDEKDAPSAVASAGDTDTDAPDLAQDSRDVLAERLTDLAQRLARGDGPAGAGGISALHAKVDEMERVLRTTPRSRPVSSAFDGTPGEGGGLWASPVSPTWMLKKRLSDMTDSVQNLELASSTADRETPGPDPVDGADAPGEAAEPGPEPAARPPFKSKVSSDVVEKMVTEAELLCQELSSVVKSLQDRREESDARATPGTHHGSDC